MERRCNICKEGNVMKKFLAMLLTACMILGLVSVASAGKITDLKTYELTANEVENWTVHASQSSRDLNVLCNLIDGLLTNDPNGNLLGAAAEKWESPDGGKTWVLTLRDNMNWCDKAGNVTAPVVANDWLVGLEWVLNFSKNGAANTSMPIEMIEGAKEYYEYTKSLAETEGDDAAKALGLDKFLEMVGISAPDDKTIVYTCKDKLAYFPTLGTYNCLYPLSAALIEKIGVDGYQAVDPDTLWYSGPYLIDNFVLNNEKTLVPNPNWYGTNERFNSVTIKMVESHDVAYQLFQTGELDHVTLTQSTLNTIYNNANHEYHGNLVEARPTKYSYSIHFVYDQLDKDGNPCVDWNTAVANEDFRLAWYYGLDLTSYLARTNAINPYSCENYAYTASGVSVGTDGTDYSDMVVKELGLSYGNGKYTRYDPEQGKAHKEAAMEALKDKVTFPVHATFWVQGSNQTQIDTANTLKQAISDYLGDDFVVLDIESYITNQTTEVRTPQLASFFINGWGADFGDPVNFVGQETYGDDNAYYSRVYSKINNATDPDLIAAYKEFTDLVNEAKAITDDQDARLAAFVKAEACMIRHALAIPCYKNVAWELTCINNYTKIYCAYGMQTYRYLDWETNDEIYTSDDYAQIVAAQ